MKEISRVLLLFISVAVMSQCKMSKTISNEDWIAGEQWIDLRDGESYGTIQIGDQVWMTENLAYLPYVNNILDGSEDEGRENDLFYYVYDYDLNNVSEAKATLNFQIYGVLYNLTAAVTSCPDGWHLPTDEEWKELEMYLGMNQDQVESTGLRGTDEGRKLKAISGWINDGNGTNGSGFTALPGGNRLGEHYRDTVYYDYMFANSGAKGNWWSSTESHDYRFAWSRSLQFSDNKVIRSGWHKDLAISIRCVKD